MATRPFRRYTVVEMYAGTARSAEAFRRWNRVRVELLVDSDALAGETYFLNRPTAPYLTTNVARLTPDQVEALVGGRVDDPIALKRELRASAEREYEVKRGVVPDVAATTKAAADRAYEETLARRAAAATPVAQRSLAAFETYLRGDHSPAGPVQVGGPEPLPKAAGASTVTFKPGEPTTLDEFEPSQPSLVGDVRAALGAMRRRGQRMIELAQMCVGPAGLGKTLFAKIIAAELGTQCFVYLAGDIESERHLDEIMREAEANPGCVLFFDEAHEFTKRLATKLYPTLEGHEYAYQGEPPRPLAPFSILGATTDMGCSSPR